MCIIVVNRDITLYRLFIVAFNCKKYRTKNPYLENCALTTIIQTMNDYIECIFLYTESFAWCYAIQLTAASTIIIIIAPLSVYIFLLWWTIYLLFVFYLKTVHKPQGYIAQYNFVTFVLFLFARPLRHPRRSLFRHLSQWYSISLQNKYSKTSFKLHLK